MWLALAATRLRPGRSVHSAWRSDLVDCAVPVKNGVQRGGPWPHVSQHRGTPATLKPLRDPNARDDADIDGDW
jgi:hypothetical protein